MSAAAATLGLMAFRGLSESATQSQNAQTLEEQAAQTQKSNALNERLEAGDTAEILSSRRAYEAGSGLTDSTGVVRRGILNKYYRDKAIRKYNADVAAGALRSEASVARLRSGTSLIGGIGEGLLAYGRLRTPKEKE
jgi:hypothetical protein